MSRARGCGPTVSNFTFDGDNRLQFLSGFPEVASHFGFRALIYGNPPLARPQLADDDSNLADVMEWDRLNALALGLLLSLNTTYMNIFIILFGRETLSLRSSFTIGCIACSYGAICVRGRSWKNPSWLVYEEAMTPSYHGGRGWTLYSPSSS